MEAVSPREFHEAAEDWRVLSDGATAFFRTDSLAVAAGFVQSISGLAGVDEHTPDIDVRRDGVTVRTVTFVEGFGGLTRGDLDLALQISGVARSLGLVSEPSGMQSLLVIPGAPDTAAVRPFWQAVLGYEPRPDSPDEDLVDPAGRGTPLWLEAMDEPRADGGGAVHLAVWVTPEAAEARVAAALAAGGHLVRDAFAPAWWTLADSAGNEVDVSTVEGRD